MKHQFPTKTLRLLHETLTTRLNAAKQMETTEISKTYPNADFIQILQAEQNNSADALRILEGIQSGEMAVYSTSDVKFWKN